MIKETLARLEARVRDGVHADDPRYTELLSLLGDLKREIDGIAETHSDQAQSIVGFTQATSHEVMRTDKNPDRIDNAMRELSSSVEGFEESHPRLVQAVNAICQSLASLGI